MSTPRAAPSALAVSSDGEKAAVLDELVAGDLELKDRAERAARARLAQVDTDDVTNAVVAALLALDQEDLAARAGRMRYGYVEPTEAAWSLLEARSRARRSLDQPGRADVGPELSALLAQRGELVVPRGRSAPRGARESAEVVAMDGQRNAGACLSGQHLQNGVAGRPEDLDARSGLERRRIRARRALRDDFHYGCRVAPSLIRTRFENRSIVARRPHWGIGGTADRLREVRVADLSCSTARFTQATGDRADAPRPSFEDVAACMSRPPRSRRPRARSESAATTVDGPPDAHPRRNRDDRDTDHRGGLRLVLRGRSAQARVPRCPTRSRRGTAPGCSSTY
jgi:hypothetical protein